LHLGEPGIELRWRQPRERLDAIRAWSAIVSQAS
jgi:hypothetical protein